MASALDKFKQLEQQQANQTNQQDTIKPAARTQRKKLPDLYQHIASKFEGHDEAKKRRLMEIKKMREEEKKNKEEEAKRKKEEQERLKREKQEQEIARRLEEEMRRQEEEKRIEEEAAEIKRLMEDQKKKEEEIKLRSQLTAKSMYEQALQKKQSKTTNKERIVNLRKGAISDIRSRLFDRKNEADETVKIPVKPKTRKKVAPPVPVKSTKDKLEKIEDPSKDNTDLDQELTVNEDKSNIVRKTSNTKQNSDNSDKIEITQGNETTIKEDGSKPKRQSVITDFAALEKTYRILGIHKEPAYIPEDTDTTPKKRHVSDGKQKKSKKKSIKKETSVSVHQEEKIKPQISIVDRIQNEAKKNFFQEMINQKKGLVKEEPVLLRAQKRKKTSIATAFEEKTTNEESKRNSIVKEELKGYGNKFASFLDKFEDEDKRGEAKQKIAQLTAQQKKFEERKKQLEEELEKRKREEEEHKRLVQMQLEEQLLEQQQIQEEEEMLLLQYEHHNNIDEADMEAECEEAPIKTETKKTKKMKNKKKKEKKEEDSTPVLKLGFAGFSENKNMFEALKQKDVQEVNSRQVKVNKLDTSSFFQNNLQDINKREVPVKVNKLKKNSFIEQLEKNSNAEPTIQRKKLSDGNSKKAEIRFESKKHSNVEIKIEAPVVEPVQLRPNKVRGSKSIENPFNARIKKTSSTLSLMFDNTKEFFRHSKEKLFKMSKEAINEIDNMRIDPKEETVTTTDMQNYLLSHVLFDKTEKPQKKTKKEKKLKKKSEKQKIDDNIEDFLDKDYKERIEQYCSLVEDTKTESKQKDSMKNVEKLPQIKLVEVKSIQEQLQSQLIKDSPKRNQNEGLDCIKSNRVKEAKAQLTTEPIIMQPRNGPKPIKVNNSIIDKIKSLEKAEGERIRREKENEERIQKLLEQELERVMKKEKETERFVDSEKVEDECESNFDQDEDNELKDDIRKRLEEEIENLEEEQRELECTEQLLIEEERIQDEEDIADVNQKETFREIKENLNEKKKQADEHKKVLRRFQHIFDKEEETIDKRSSLKVGSIHDKLENFLNVSENEKVDKKFEDSVLTGVSDIMSKVKGKFESQQEDYFPVMKKGEVKRKLGKSAIYFEQISQEAHEETSTDRQEREWAWKSKPPQELSTFTSNKNDDNISNEENIIRGKKDIMDLKFKEMLNDINAVKERMKNRDIQEENKAKRDEMNMFMDEIQYSLDQIDKDYPITNSSSDEFEPRIEKKKVKNKKVIIKRSSSSYNTNTVSIVDNIRKELMTDGVSHKKVGHHEIDNIGVSVSHLKKNISKNFESEIKQDKEVMQSNSGIVSRISEMLINEEKDEYKALTKAPKVLLRTTSKEDNDAPAKTLDELKQDQEKKKWAWKAKDMKDIQNYMKSYDDVIPESLKQNQKHLEELDDEMSVVKSYMPGKESDLIVQIREEKEKEFESFMSNMKTFLGNETKTQKEGNFKKDMKSYLDLIDEKKESSKLYKIPELKTKSVNKLKKQLFEDSTNEVEKSDSPKVSRLPSALIEKIEMPIENDNSNKCRSDIGSNQTASVKDYFEKKQEVAPSPVIKPKSVHPVVKTLQASRNENDQTKILNQLKFKLKTINELQSYIESHESLCIPTMIEAIQKFCITKKEDDKLAAYIRFIDIATSFKDQKARSTEQKIFKDNIQAYLNVIENIDVRVNGTPKLQKHTPIKIEPKSSNSKKNKIEKENVQSLSMSKMTPEEKRKHIFQKYGFKDHISKKKDIDISSCSDIDDDNEEDLTGLSDNDLCLKYGLPPISIPTTEEKSKASSVSSFKSILSKIRQVSTEGSVVSSPIMRRRVSDQLTPKLVRRNSIRNEEDLPKSGSNAKIKDFFETIATESPTPTRKEMVEPENNFNSKIIRKFETGVPSPQINRKSLPLSLQNSTNGSNIKNLIALGEKLVNNQETPPLMKKDEGMFSLDKSRSFSKFKDAFETGVGLNDDDDSSDEEKQSPIKSELKALKSSSKLQSMFRINRSASDAERSPKVGRDMDSKTLNMISKSKTAITNMFESKTPKVTFGGSSSSKQTAPESPKQTKKIANQSNHQQSTDGRKWVFDTIQKYFDVIVEEDQEEREEFNDAAEYFDNQRVVHTYDEDESDYTSAEEELPEINPIESTPFQPKVNVKTQVDVSKYFKEKAVYTPTTARKLSAQVRSPSTPIDYPAQEKARRKFSLDEMVDNAAKEFDALTDGSDMSLDDDRKYVNNSYSNINSLSRSGSSSKIRGLFSSVIHGSAKDLNMSVFKSNLMSHLNTRGGGISGGTRNLDPGVADGDTDSEFSEYDD